MHTIRILPMNHSIDDFNGKTIEEIQKQFFCVELIKEKGWYQYKTSGLRAQDGDLVLFQMDSQIIASAEYRDCLPGKEDGWNGSILFYCNTIKIFKPISKEKISSYISNFKKFGDYKSSFVLNDEEYDKLVSRISTGL